MAMIECGDYNDVRPDGASAAKRKTRRSRRGKGTSKQEASSASE